MYLLPGNLGNTSGAGHAQGSKDLICDLLELRHFPFHLEDDGGVKSQKQQLPGKLFIHCICYNNILCKIRADVVVTEHTLSVVE